MIGIRQTLAAVATLLMMALDAPLWAQNSELPLQPGQDQQEEVAKLNGLLKSDAGLHAKAVACKRLAVIGTKSAVPALASLLGDEKLSHYARFGLEPIPDPSVDVALRDALGRVTGRLLVGVVNSIGNRKDEGAIDTLAKLLNDDDQRVVDAAAGSLGRIGTVATAKILEETLSNAPSAVRADIGDACLACAEELLGKGKRNEAIALFDVVRQADVAKHVQIAAMRGAILAREAAGVELIVEQLNADDADFFGVALRAARELEQATVSAALVGELQKLPQDRQMLVILALGDRGDEAAIPVVLKAAESDSADLRLAALRLLGKLGDATAVPLLMEAALASDSGVAEVAKASLETIKGDDVNAAIAGELEADDGRARLLVIELIGTRRIASAIGSLRKASQDADDQVQLAAIKALGETIGPDELAALAERLVKPASSEKHAAVQAALQAAAIRMPDPEECAATLVECLRDAPLAAKVFVFELLSEVGGANALQAVSASARDSDEKIQDAATRVLGEWMSPDAAAELLELAQTLDSNNLKIRTLRGYIRIIRQLGLPDDERLKMCRTAMQVCERDAEKVLVLEVLGRIPTADALAEVLPYLKNSALKKEAGLAAVSIGEKILESHRAAVVEAMGQVLSANPEADVTQRARRLQRRGR